MKVLHVMPCFYPAHVYGGPIESVYGLCRHIAKLGCEVSVLTTDTNGPRDVLDVEKGHDVELSDGLRVRYCRRRYSHSASPELAGLLRDRIRWADVVHLTFVYNFPTMPTLALARMQGKPVVWSPRGTLDAWPGRRRESLKYVWDTACKAIAPRRIFFHVTSQREAVHCKRRFPGGCISVVPNGIEVPASILSRKRPSDRELRLLYLGRHDPAKAIENLLFACAGLNRDLNFDWSLTIAGRENGDYSRGLRRTIDTLGLTKRITLAGEVLGEAKEQMFKWADVLVMPSHTESFGMVVAEALARAVPVIASQGTPWSEVRERGCGLWVKNTPESLCEAIQQISRMPLNEMGQLGRRWMQERYSWPAIAQSMIDVYDRAVRQRTDSALCAQKENSAGAS